MHVIVKLNPAATRRERGARGGTTIGLLKKSGRTLAPLHPTTRDASADSLFLLEIDDPAEAARVAEELLTDPQVEAAYLKPADEPP